MTHRARFVWGDLQTVVAALLLAERHVRSADTTWDENQAERSAGGAGLDAGVFVAVAETKETEILSIAWRHDLLRQRFRLPPAARKTQ